MRHTRNGFAFERSSDGAVRVMKLLPIITAEGQPQTERDAVAYDVTLPEDEWAGIVAAMSRVGESLATQQRAREFHAGAT